MIYNMHIKPNVVVIQMYVDRSIFAREICEDVVVSCSFKMRFLRQGSRIYFKHCLPIANERKLSGYDRSICDKCQEVQNSKDSDLYEYLHLLRLSLQIPLNVYV